jgi:hypothetical protein
MQAIVEQEKEIIPEWGKFIITELKKLDKLDKLDAIEQTLVTVQADHKKLEESQNLQGDQIK